MEERKRRRRRIQRGVVKNTIIWRGTRRR